MLQFVICHTLSLIEGTKRNRKDFYFEAWWMMEETFKKESVTSGDLLQKLKGLAKNLIGWSRGIKWKKNELKVQLYHKLEDLQKTYRQNGILNDLIDDKPYWEQKARINRLKAYNKNSKFFHFVVSQCKKGNTINCLKTDDGKVTRDHSKMAHIAKDFVEDLFT
ncbi:reverse transcriptase [Gossypium australe]|uniref:Reverse transcriptase n=1 Tax=Gossypium australe TaxID=47621 RepID=A0A5B6VJ75_9ROSI|nr:reverse transcriptase [Gossypium australe]